MRSLVEGVINHRHEEHQVRTQLKQTEGRAAANELSKDVLNMSSMRKSADRAAGAQVSDASLPDEQPLSAWHR